MELINQKLGVDNREKITTGQVIKALILNGLGMLSRPLYLFRIWYSNSSSKLLKINQQKTEIMGRANL